MSKNFSGEESLRMIPKEDYKDLSSARGVYQSCPNDVENPLGEEPPRYGLGFRRVC